MAEIDQRVAESLAQMAEHSARITANNERIAENSARLIEIDDRIAASNAQIAKNTAIIIEQGKRLDAMIVELRQQGTEFRGALQEQKTAITQLNTTMRNTAWILGITVSAAIGLATILAQLL